MERSLTDTFPFSLDLRNDVEVDRQAKQVGGLTLSKQLIKGLGQGIEICKHIYERENRSLCWIVGKIGYMQMVSF